MKNEKVILVGLSGKPSMRALHPTLTQGTIVEKVELRSGRELIRVHDNKKDFNKYKSFSKKDFSLSNSVVVRWGNRIPMTLNNCVVYNTAEAVGNASNKRTARQLLEKEKVTIPILVTPENFKSNYLPIIARPEFHAKGKDFVVLKTKEEFLQHYTKFSPKRWYYSQFIDKDRELRVHCAHGKILVVSEKPRPADKSLLLWNFSVVEEEWKVLHWNEYKAEWCKKALSAVKALGLDFGAVDIMIKGKESYVLEINTACSFVNSPYLQKRYNMYFNWLFSSKEKREHWDFSKFESGKSTAWKNFQLSENV